MSLFLCLVIIKIMSWPFEEWKNRQEIWWWWRGDTQTSRCTLLCAFRLLSHHDSAFVRTWNTFLSEAHLTVWACLCHFGSKCVHEWPFLRKQFVKSVNQKHMKSDCPSSNYCSFILCCWQLILSQAYLCVTLSMDVYAACIYVYASANVCGFHSSLVA